MILKKNNKSHLEKNMFLDEAVDLQRFDILKYPAIDKISDKQLLQQKISRARSIFKACVSSTLSYSNKQH